MRLFIIMTPQETNIKLMGNLGKRKERVIKTNTKKFIIQIFGINEKGETFSVFVIPLSKATFITSLAIFFSY